MNMVHPSGCMIDGSDRRRFRSRQATTLINDFTNNLYIPMLHN